MSNAFYKVPEAKNESIKSYAPGSPEKKSLKKKLQELKSKKIEIPLIIGGKEIKTGNMGKCRIPHDHQHILGTYHKAGEKEIQMAIDASQKAWKKWSKMHWRSRVAIF